MCEKSIIYTFIIMLKIYLVKKKVLKSYNSLKNNVFRMVGKL
jgi:hypothetical protein